MAGLGYKVFNVGDVLTAAQVQGYLQDQSIMRFASAAARSSALGASVAEGMYSYLLDTHTTEYYNGSAWVSASNPGDITAVNAGTALTGGGTSGDVTLNYDIANFGSAKNAAGRNAIINGDFGVWQRGTSFTVTGTEAVVYKADRWAIQSDGSTTTRTVSAQTFTPGTAPVAGYEGTYFFRFAQTTAGNNSYNYLGTRLEDVRLFAGQTVTLSFWAKADSTRTVSTYITQNFGSGGSAGINSSSQSNSLTTSWQRFSQTITLGNLSGKTIGTSSFLEIIFQLPSGNITPTIDFWGMQLEAGSIASPFQTATGTKQGELAACERYFQAYTPATVYSYYGIGCYNSTTLCYIAMKTKTTMRTAPTAAFSAANTFLANQGGAKAISAVTADQLSPDFAGIVFTTASATSGGSVIIQSNNTTSSYIQLSAEL